MTAVLSCGVPSLLTHRPYDPMIEGVNDVWRRQYTPQQMPLNYWQQTHNLPMGSVHETEFRLLEPDSVHYEESASNDSGPMISPHLGYVPHTSWESDIDMETPSTAGFPNEPLEAYHSVGRHNHVHQHLALPPPNDQIQASAHSPLSSYGEMSPQNDYARLQNSVHTKEERPALTRSITAPAAPNHRPRRATNTGTASTKRSNSEDEDDEYIPNEESKPRGRKRQRIPHTAVERRYRENLNAHLDKLRQTVPSLANKRAAGASKPGDGLGEGAKPSKCEILNGAIEHIGALGKENLALKAEIKALRSQLADMDSWCGASLRGSLGR